MKRHHTVKSILLLVNCVAVYALAGLPFTSYAQGLVEAPIALTPNVDCPNGCKWSLSILNSTGSDFAVGEGLCRVYLRIFPR